MASGKMYYLTDAEVKELRGLQALVRAEIFKQNMVEANTAVVKRSREWLDTQRDLVTLLQSHLELQISKAARARNIEGAVTIDLVTRSIKEV